MANSTVVQGNAKPLFGGHIYEKTSATNEIVNKRLLARGTASHQLKLCAAQGIPIAIGVSQLRPGYDSNNNIDSDYAVDGKMITNAALAPDILVRGTLAASQTIVAGDKLASDDNGLLKKWASSGDVSVAIAEEAKTTGAGETAEILIRPLQPGTNETHA